MNYWGKDKLNILGCGKPRKTTESRSFEDSGSHRESQPAAQGKLKPTRSTGSVVKYGTAERYAESLYSHPFVSHS